MDKDKGATDKTATTNSTTTNSNTTRVDQGEDDINSILKNFNGKVSNMEGVGDKAVNMGKAGPSTSGANVQKTGTQSGSTPLSFADMFKDKKPKKIVKISEMRNEHCVAGANITIPLKIVDEVSSRFVNTLYGYFIGKRLAFLIVENYVRNTWAKFGLQRVMLNNGFFSAPI